MNRSTTTRLGLAALTATAALSATVTAGATPTTAHPPAEPSTTASDSSATRARAGTGAALAGLRRSLGAYHDVEVARAHGYVPASGCEESEAGAMGLHYLNPRLASQPVDPEHPAILLYHPTETGELRLVGAEWFQADADQDLDTDGDRPSLWGHPFDGPMPGHGPAMPVHYDLHVWLFDSNPAGVFAPWNPSLSC